jgi:disulfide bond formation protein DsbB
MTKAKLLTYASWFAAIFATMGSLFFSEVLHYPPCVLCWYQRIAIYPLVLLIPVGIILKDKKLPYYILPLTLIGATIALYHNLLYYKIIPESLAPCIQGISCTTKYFEWLGFITIPFLSFTTLLFITVAMFIIKKENNE